MVFISAFLITFLEYFSHLAFAGALYDVAGLVKFLQHGFTANVISFAIGNLAYYRYGSIPFGILSTPSFDIPIAANLAQELSQCTENNSALLFPTFVLCLLAINFVVGIVFLVVGYFNCSVWAQYIPNPVVYGFLSGNGALLVITGLRTAGARHLNINILDPKSMELFHGTTAIILAGLLLLTTQMKEKDFSMKADYAFPFFISLSICIFYACLFFSSFSVETARELGWLYAQGNRETNVGHDFIDALQSIYDADVSVSCITKHLPSRLISISILLLFGQAMRTVGVEIATATNANSSSDIKVTGTSILVSGMFGGRTLLLSTASLLNFRLNSSHSRYATLLCTIISLGFLFSAKYVIPYIPKFIFGGSLAFMGFDLLRSSLYKPVLIACWFDRLVLASVFLTYICFSPLFSILLGIGLTVSAFIHQYSITSSRATVSTLSRHLQFGRPSGNLYNSWPTPHYHVLKTYGHQILDFQFSGYLFFGNVVDLLKRIESFIAQSYIEAKYNDNENANKCDALRSGDNPYKYYSSEKKKMRRRVLFQSRHQNINSTDVDDKIILLNFTQVSGCDFTAVSKISKSIQTIQTQKNTQAIFAGIDAHLYIQFRKTRIINQISISNQPYPYIESEKLHFSNSAFYNIPIWKYKELQKRYLICCRQKKNSEFTVQCFIKSLKLPVKQVIVKKLIAAASVLTRRESGEPFEKLFSLLFNTLGDKKFLSVISGVEYTENVFPFVSHAMHWGERMILNSFPEYIKANIYMNNDFVPLILSLKDACEDLPKPKMIGKMSKVVKSHDKISYGMAVNSVHCGRAQIVNIVISALMRLDVFDFSVKVDTIEFVLKLLQNGKLFELIPGQKLGPCAELGAVYLVLKGSLYVRYENCVDFMPNIICQGSFFGTSEFYKKRVFRLRCSIYGGYERNNIIMKFPYHKLR